jgi:hypothetical protein
MSENLNISISKNEQESPWVLVNNKNEYINRLIKVLSPSIITGFYSIYNNTKNKNKVHKYLLREFQNELSNTPHWNQLIITGEFERIKKDSGCDWLDNLIKNIFKKYAKTLNIDTSTTKGLVRNIQIPNSYEFIHKCYINIAREVWKNPKLFYHKLNNNQISENSIKITKIVEESIKDTILELMPLEKFIDDYVSNETTSNSKYNEDENENEDEDEDEDENEDENKNENEDIDYLKYNNDESDNNSERSDIISNQESMINKLSDKNERQCTLPIDDEPSPRQGTLNSKIYEPSVRQDTDTHLQSDGAFALNSAINNYGNEFKEMHEPAQFSPNSNELREGSDNNEYMTKVPYLADGLEIENFKVPVNQNNLNIKEEFKFNDEDSISSIIEKNITPIVEEITPIVEEITPIVEEITSITNNEIIDNVSSQTNTLTNEKIIEINDISLCRPIHLNNNNEEYYEKTKTKKYMNELKLRRNNDKIKNLLGINVDYPTFIKNKEKIKKILLSKSIEAL